VVVLVFGTPNIDNAPNAKEKLRYLIIINGIMKKILFVGQSLKVGGVERALVEQINSLCSEGYDVELFLFYRGGEYLNSVSPNVRVKGGGRLLSCMSMTNAQAKSSALRFIIRSIMYLLSKIIGNKRLYSIVFGLIKPMKGYDLAVSYFHDVGPKGLYYGCNSFVLNNVESRKKIAWIHSDSNLIKVESCDNRKIYQCFDAVVNVSYAMKEKFDKLQVINSDKSKVVYNRYNKEEIIRLSNEEIDSWKNDRLVLITVGRIEKNKSTMELLTIAKRIKEKNHSFYWYFIGTGCLMDEASKYVKDNGLIDNIIFTGQLSNPYPYIKNADIYISGSISETFGLSILESLILNTPVVAYRYDAIDEILKNNSNGVVVNSFEDLFTRICDFFDNPDKLGKIKELAHPLCDYNKLNDNQFKALI
jgi:glycosyltransferase involved in cell wall biosynthesis